MKALDEQLQRLNGRVSNVQTRINENGQKIKVIKITKSKYLENSSVKD